MPHPRPAERPPLEVAAIALVRDRRMLMVTARGRDVIYLPGGKIDDGESAADAAAREAREEVGLQLEASALQHLFEVVAPAHGQGEGRMVRMRVFLAETDAEPVPQAEVEAVHWVGTADAGRCPPAGVEVLRRMSALGLVD